MRVNRTGRGIALWTCAVLLFFALAPEALAQDEFAGLRGSGHSAWPNAHRGGASTTLAHLKLRAPTVDYFRACLRERSRERDS
jgi:hypothetical protein